MYLVPKEPLFEAKSDANQEKKKMKNLPFFYSSKGLFWYCLTD